MAYGFAVCCFRADILLAYQCTSAPNEHITKLSTLGGKAGWTSAGSPLRPVMACVPGVRKAGRLPARRESRRGPVCPKSGVGERDQSTSPAHPSRTSGSSGSSESPSRTDHLPAGRSRSWTRLACLLRSPTERHPVRRCRAEPDLRRCVASSTVPISCSVSDNS